MRISISNIKQFLGHKNSIYTIEQLNDTEFLSAGADGMLVKWSINEPQEGLLLAQADHPIYSMTSFGIYIALGLSNGDLYLHHMQDPSKSRRIEVSKQSIYSLCSVNSSTLLVGDGSGFVTAFDESFKVLRKIRLGQTAIRVMYSWQDHIYTGATGGMLYVLNSDLELIKNIQAHDDSLFALCATSKHLISGGKDAMIKHWNTELELVQEPIPAHLYHVKSLAWNEQENVILSTSMDKSIRIWDSDRLELLKVINFEKYETHTSSINCGLWFNENTLISCSDDRKICSFELNFNTP